MLVRHQFRHRIGLLVAVAAAALVTVTAVSLVLGRRGERQLAGIETRYVPLIELDRDLKTLFAQIPRTLEDAVTAAEDSKLRDADVLHADLLKRLRDGSRTIADNGGDAALLEIKLGSYYVNARVVSESLVAGTPPARLAPSIEAMARAKAEFTGQLETATRPDRRQLAAAFAVARASQRDALWIDIAVAISALVLLAALSWRIIRHTVTALHAVALGVERLARGDFAREIDVATRDELGDLAREANRTAARLRDYRDQAQRQAAALRDAYATVEARNATLVATQQLLEDRAAELARASRYKSEFLANMSHELRTPLNSIMILSKVLSENHEGGMTDKQVEFSLLIHKSGEELLGLINEVLDLAKVESGRQVLVCASLRLVEVEDYVRRMFRPLAAQRDLVFEVECSGELPVAIRTDWKRLSQILKNLIANAFKFTERGRVAVRVSRGWPDGRRISDVAIADPLIISVSDTGIGIEDDKQAWIFEAFAQAEIGISRKFGGTGLGLTIAKQLAVRLGGDLAVESRVGEGGTFSVILPVEGPPHEAGQPRTLGATVPPSLPAEDRNKTPSGPPYLVGSIDAHILEPALDGKTVLVVDDDMRNVYSISNALRAKRLQVITATDGQEALDELERNPELDAVLMDVVMPRMDGHEAIRQIRAQARFHDLPIIAITAKTMHGARERCMAAGASEYVPKPIDIGQLLGLLRSWLA